MQLGDQKKLPSTPRTPPPKTPHTEGGLPEPGSSTRGRVTVVGYLASPSEDDFGRAIGYLNDHDDEALAKLMAAGRVIKLKGGIPVSIVETKVLTGKVKIRLRGDTVELWTNIEAVSASGPKNEATHQAASSQTAPASLVGRWRSPTTGDVFQLDSIGNTLTVEVVTSRSLKQGIGTLSLDNSKGYWAGSFSAVFFHDVRKAERETGMALVVFNRDEVELWADIITWDRNGRETSRVAQGMRLRRAK